MFSGKSKLNLICCNQLATSKRCSLETELKTPKPLAKSQTNLPDTMGLGDQTLAIHLKPCTPVRRGAVCKVICMDIGRSSGNQLASYIAIEL